MAGHEQPEMPGRRRLESPSPSSRWFSDATPQARSPYVVPTPVRADGRVWFNSPANSTIEITPYSRIYGVHPRFFDFDACGAMQLTPAANVCIASSPISLAPERHTVDWGSYDRPKMCNATGAPHAVDWGTCHSEAAGAASNIDSPPHFPPPPCGPPPPRLATRENLQPESTWAGPGFDCQASVGPHISVRPPQQLEFPVGGCDRDADWQLYFRHRVLNGETSAEISPERQLDNGASVTHMGCAGEAVEDRPSGIRWHGPNAPTNISWPGVHTNTSAGVCVDMPTSHRQTDGCSTAARSDALQSNPLRTMPATSRTGSSVTAQDNCHRGGITSKPMSSYGHRLPPRNADQGPGRRSLGSVSQSSEQGSTRRSLGSVSQSAADPGLGRRSLGSASTTGSSAMVGAKREDVASEVMPTPRGQSVTAQEQIRICASQGMTPRLARPGPPSQCGGMAKVDEEHVQLPVVVHRSGGLQRSVVRPAGAAPQVLCPQSATSFSAHSGPAVMMGTKTAEDAMLRGSINMQVYRSRCGGA